MGPPYWLSYAVVKDPRRGKRQGRDEPRAQESGTRIYGVLPQAAYSDEARAPKSIIQEGKKGIRSLMIVFRKIRLVIGFSGEIMTRRNRRISRYSCWNKVIGEMRVRRKAGLFRRARCKPN